MSRLLAVASSTAIIAATAVLTACGSADRQSTALLERALERPVKSANVALDVRVEAEGAPGIDEPLRARVSGPYRSGEGRQLPSFDWDVAFSGAGQNISAGLVSTGDNAFVTFLGNAYEVGEREVARKNRRMQRASPERPRGSLEDLGLDPARWIAGARNEGDEDVAGVATTHLSGEVDVAKMLADLDRAKLKAGRRGSEHRAMTAAERKRLVDGVEDNRFEVWVAKSDETIRRVTGEVELTRPREGRKSAPRADGPLAGLSQAERVRIEFSVELSDVGEQQRIQAPANPRPLEDLGRALEGMGRAGAMGGPQGPTAGAGDRASPFALAIE